MTSEQISDLARKAGFRTGVMFGADGQPVYAVIQPVGENCAVELAKLANLVMDECIKTCFSVQSMLISVGAGEDAENGAGDCIDAIRARKDSA
ncbi:hypothetical protein G7048_19080 [Diaphorobacter sp. HDW4B]|uniref:hypothetical protein n=1 Tax=Diaphorobacter sp. HDW4B TaxID=2714925 RepID=UPI00140974FE|nr:hypothetical protein [Diaphorobacter sp. HDW4B]QIL72271.1 hypothetical protein G7048_19080 [Diaphorobacter sp. HDW4B]